MISKSAIDWLLEENQPSIKYLAQRTLLGMSENEPNVSNAKSEILKKGWAADILGKQLASGGWVSEDSLYTPKYLSTNWMLLILSDLGMTKADPRIGKACKLWIRSFAKSDGGFNSEGAKKGHLCITGNMVRALVNFGYSEHPKVRRAFQWFVKNSSDKGGWSCFLSGRNLDSWEPMSAFAVFGKQNWTKSMKNVVEKGAEFFLERELHKQGEHYEPWFRFHYPVHYYYDLLVGLEFMTSLGYGSDPRMKYAIRVLKNKRRPDGRWNLDSVHPDLEGGTAEWNKMHPERAPVPFALEVAGEPSKMITLKAMQVLKRLE